MPHARRHARRADRQGMISRLGGANMKRVSLALGLAFTIAGAGFAQEHPEHPKATKKPPQSANQAPRTFSMDELEKAITADIEAKQKKNDGWYSMKDKKTGQTLKMKLD